MRFPQVGEFFANGQGLISNGIEDIDDNGTLGSKIPFTGTYLIAANGRGTATRHDGSRALPIILSAFYVVSRGSAKFVEVDASSAPRIAGYAVQQTPNASFTVSSLTGNYAFLLTGVVPGREASPTAGSFSSACWQRHAHKRHAG